ncbi:MAG: hypothetical protein ACI81L_003059 [Verrucomicrobiales bacterium]|jgi:hypothetical protein
MARYDQDWCDSLAKAVGAEPVSEFAPLRLLCVVTDTDDGKVAFYIDLDGGAVVGATAGKLPRGEKAHVTVTAKEAVLIDIWAAKRTRDSAFMRGDLKIEGAYERWLDELVPMFSAAPWVDAWLAASQP